MSVLIKGMDMPNNCEKCLYSSWSNFYQIYVCNAIRHDEPVLFDKKQVKSTNTVRSGRADNCPLVPVPKHGDLIDRKELIKNDHQHYEYMSDEFYVTVRDIEAAPTVIPAESEGE